MMSKQDVLRWINTLDDDSHIAISDGGLALLEIRSDQIHSSGDVTPSAEGLVYLEVGGVPCAS